MTFWRSDSPWPSEVSPDSDTDTADAFRSDSAATMCIPSNLSSKIWFCKTHQYPLAIKIYVKWTSITSNSNHRSKRVASGKQEHSRRGSSLVCNKWRKILKEFRPLWGQVESQAHVVSKFDWKHIVRTVTTLPYRCNFQSRVKQANFLSNVRNGAT